EGPQLVVQLVHVAAAEGDLDLVDTQAGDRPQEAGDLLGRAVDRPAHVPPGRPDVERARQRPDRERLVRPPVPLPELVDLGDGHGEPPPGRAHREPAVAPPGGPPPGRGPCAADPDRHPAPGGPDSAPTVNGSSARPYRSRSSCTWATATESRPSGGPTASQPSPRRAARCRAAADAPPTQIGTRRPAGPEGRPSWAARSPSRV